MADTSGKKNAARGKTSINKKKKSKSMSKEAIEQQRNYKSRNKKKKKPKSTTKKAIRQLNYRKRKKEEKDDSSRSDASFTNANDKRQCCSPKEGTGTGDKEQVSLKAVKKAQYKSKRCGKCKNCKSKEEDKEDCSKKIRKRLREDVLQLTNHPTIIEKHMEEYFPKECSSPCHNCHRTRIRGLVGSSACYDFDMYLVPSYYLIGLRSPLRSVSRAMRAETSRDYVLCSQCKTFLLDPSKAMDGCSKDEIKLHEKIRWNWENVWPSFYWDLLTGKDESTGKPFYMTYNAETLWKFVPGGIVRDFYRDSLLGLHNRILEKSTSVPEDIIKVYEPCLKNNPISHFVDRTEDVSNFRRNISEYSTRGFLLALDPQRVPFYRKEEGSNEEVDDEAIIDEFLTCRLCEDNSCDRVTSRSDKVKLIEDRKFKPMMIPDVLCPHGCSEFAHQCKSADPSLLIQSQLRKVQLNLRPGGHARMYLIETSRQDYIRREDEEEDFLLMNKEWPIKPTMQLVTGKGLVISVCRYHGTASETKYLLHHPPRKYQNNLSAVKQDSLAHAVCRPRIVSTVKSSKYNSSSTLSAFSSSYAGSDCSNVSSEPLNYSSSYMLFQHELLSFHERRDTHELAHIKVKEGKIPRDHLDEWLVHADEQFGNVEMQKKLLLLKRGSTFTPTENAIILQKHPYESSKVAVVVKTRAVAGQPQEERTLYLLRSWSPMIYSMQVEDLFGWGCPIKGILPYSRSNHNATMMLWCLCGMISACNTLHYAIDQKSSPHRYDGWSGHILAHINRTYMKHNNSRCPAKSPFLGSVTMKNLRNLVGKFMPEDMLSYSGASDENPEYFYGMNLDYFQLLFPECDYPTLSLHSRVTDFIELEDVEKRKTKDVVVVLRDTPPGNTEEATFTVADDSSVYEARVIISIYADTSGEDTCSPSKFSAERYARHGGGYSQWWVQKRDGTKHKQFMRQYVHERDDKCSVTDPFPKLESGNNNAFRYIVVFVKVKQCEAERYRLDMYRSVGTQGDVFCNCTKENPLIMCGTSAENKRCCMMEKCTNVEMYTCGRSGCTTRICEDCFKDMNKGGGPIKVISPSTSTYAKNEQTIHPVKTTDVSENSENGESGVNGSIVHSDGESDSNHDPLSDCCESDEYHNSDENDVDNDDEISCVEEYKEADHHDDDSVIDEGNTVDDDCDDQWVEDEDEDGEYDAHHGDGSGGILSLNKDDTSCVVHHDFEDGVIEDANTNNEANALDDMEHCEEIPNMTCRSCNQTSDGCGSCCSDDPTFVQKLPLRDSLALANQKIGTNLQFDIHTDKVLAREKKWLPWGVTVCHSNTKKFYTDWYLKQPKSLAKSELVDNFVDSCYKFVKWSRESNGWVDRFDVNKEADRLTLGYALKQKRYLPHDDSYLSVNDILEDYVTGADLVESPVDSISEGDDAHEGCVPKTNCADMEYTLLEKGGGIDSDSYYGTTVPMHVLFNQAGSLCTRYKKRIRGSRVQQNFVQKLVSSVRGFAFPLLYFAANLFPRHFWSSATHDETAILGCPPISCMRKASHPDGFASSIQVARNLATHSSSSASTCHSYTAFSYEMQANRASSDIDSRLVARHGFRVSTTTRSGLELADGDDSQLHESLDSRQGAMNLAAASQFVEFDAFVTMTCNQSEHPGIRHLHNWKDSMGWTDMVEDYGMLPSFSKEDVERSFVMAYTSVLNRTWLEVRKLVLQFITYSSTFLLKRAVEVFFRDEYQEKSGNLCHIHGLIALCRDDMENEEFQELVCDLQRNAVCDVFDPADIEEYMNEGLFRDAGDWRTCQATASEVLEHKCDERCQIRVDHKGKKEDTKCKKPHPEFDSIDPLEDDFIPFTYDWSDNCLEILAECGLYEVPSPGFPKGKFFHKVLNPTRHMGKVTSGTGGNMSPVTPKLFALTRSMQNFQVITNTNGVSRYVVKYIIKMDTGNRCIVHADKHTGAIIRAEHQFLHNTKVTRSAINEQKAWKKSRKRNNPVGRFISFNEHQQQLLGINDVFTTMKFVSIPSKPLEQRSTTKISLDSQGNLRRPDNRKVASDVTSSITDVHAVRKKKLPSCRQLSCNQQIILSAKTMESKSYCKVSLFGVRPVELMELFPRIGDYYRWFITEEKILGCLEIEAALVEDVTKCQWIDGLGRRVKLRNPACDEVVASLMKVKEQSVQPYSWSLRNHLLKVLRDGKSSTFVAEDDGTPLPIPVFSNITPKNPTAFLLHIMLLLGEVSTELDLRNTESMKHSLALSKLIPSDDLKDKDRLVKYSNDLLYRVVTEVFPIQPITMRKLEEYVVMSKRLFDSILLEDAIPVSDLPPCILTEMLNKTEAKLQREWDERTKAQLNAMLETIPKFNGLPSMDEIVAAVKGRKEINWDPLDVITRSKDQSESSFKEQRKCISMGMSAVKKYKVGFGLTTQTKGVLAHGSPGSGKSFVLEAQGLYAMTQGLRVMSTSLMAVRSNALGGHHIHRLFMLEVNKNSNIFRLAELAMDKIERKSNVKMKHILLTMDVLLLDECGQLSAQQFALLDIILRHLRQSTLPFGGVLIFGTFDHAQLGAIHGLPFLLSSHILTDFNLIRMKHSVRAHSDPHLQEIQKITRMSPSLLKGNVKLKKKFTSLIKKHIKFASDWEDEKIGPNTQRMYPKRRKAVNAAEANAKNVIRRLQNNDTSHVVSNAKDYQQAIGSRALMAPASDDGLKTTLDRKCREPRTLVFFSGALFEATMNNKNFSQSQVLRLINVPSQKDVDNHVPIRMMASPCGSNHYSIDTEERVPTEEELEKQGWTKVEIDTGRDDELVTHGAYQGKRVQYRVRHLGSSTINKQMGNTILCPVAIEMTEECCPWEKGQIVVMLSRSPRSDLITIVGTPDFAIEKMWRILCKSTQWTPLIESILDKLSIDGDDEHILDPEEKVLEYAELYPFKVCDIELPTAESGYVYLLMSVVHPERTYVGQCKNLHKRIRQHNSGSGSKGTASAVYHPYALVAYLTNLGHMNESDRMSLERLWQKLNNYVVNEERITDIEARIDNGRRVMVSYNESSPEEDKIRLIKCIMT